MARQAAEVVAPTSSVVAVTHCWAGRGVKTPKTTSDCPFCPVWDTEPVPGVKARRPRFPRIATPVSLWAASHVGGMYASFEPLAPVVPGHLLVIPVAHVESAAAGPELAAGAVEVAATLGRQYRSFNLITSVGAPATQTVKHLHVHVVPRRRGDGLVLPWTGQ